LPKFAIAVVKKSASATIVKSTAATDTGKQRKVSAPTDMDAVLSFATDEAGSPASNKPKTAHSSPSEDPFPSSSDEQEAPDDDGNASE
jgi:hypothetical protein